MNVVLLLCNRNTFLNYTDIPWHYISLHIIHNDFKILYFRLGNSRTGDILQIQRINGFAVMIDRVVQVITGRTACGSHITDNIVLLYTITNFVFSVFAEMPVKRFITI